MKPEQWQQAREVLADALELKPEERPAFLDRVCSSDHALRREVERLLSSNDEARSSFLQSSAFRVTLMPGTMVGDYEIVRLLGAGGMGEVYRAHDKHLGRDVAIKVLPAFLSHDPDRLRRFEQEARAAAALNHPNILAVHQMGTYEGAPYLVSELLEGSTLRELLMRGSMPVRKVIDYGVQIARGLAAAHEKGIVHRDLKPENLFVTRDGWVKILDFGLAKLMQPQPCSEHTASMLSDATAAGVIMGTVGYMSPEQVNGGSTDHRADIFAFGAILYEMLTGKRAFQKPTSVETMSAILNDEPPEISQLVPSLPVTLLKVVHRCLEKTPEHRFQSTSDLVFALEASSDSHTSPEAYISLPRRRVVLWTIAVVSLLVLPIGMVSIRHMMGPGKVTDHSAPTQKRLTTNADEVPVRTAVISPDGAYLAYSDATGAYLKQISTGETRPIMLPRGIAGHPVAWYPDSKHFILQWFANAQEKPSLWSLSILGGDARKLADDAWGATVSNDGSRIAFVRSSVGVSGICRLNLDCRYALGREIWTMAPDGADPEKIIEANREDRFGPVAWSPGGQQIAYLRLHGHNDFFIETRDLRTGSQTVLLADHRLNLAPEIFAWQPAVAWTRDGRIIFALHEPSPDEADSNAWAIQLDAKTGTPSGKPIRLTNSPGAISSFSVTADGKQLGFIKNTLRPQVYVGELDPLAKVLTNNRRMTLQQGESLPFSWTPDNQSVIFASNRNGRFEIFKQRIDQPVPELLARDPARNEFVPRPSPDGSEVFYLSYPVGDSTSSSTRLMRVPMAGGPPRLVLESPSPAIENQQCARTPATNCLFSKRVSAETETFFSFDPVHGSSREILRVSETEEQSGGWTLSPDGLTLGVYGRDPHEGRIRLFSMRDGSERELLVKGWSGLSTLDWANDSRSFFGSVMRPDGTIVLLHINLEGDARPLLEQKNGDMCWAIPSSDGKRLASMLMNGESNSWVLEDF